MGRVCLSLLLFDFFSYISIHSLVVIDRHDASKHQAIGGISVPLYEVTPGKKVKIKKLLNDPAKVCLYSAVL